MVKNIDDLRKFVKERLDDTSYKNDSISLFVLLCSLVGIILFAISCNRKIIENSLSEVAFLSSFILLLIVPIANYIYYIDTRDLIRKEKSSISTFYVNPFIKDNIIKIVLLLYSIFMVGYFSENFISIYQMRACIIAASIMLVSECSIILFKKKLKQELFPMSFITIMFFTIFNLSLAVWILPDFTYNLDFNIVKFSLSITALIGFIYYCAYVFYLSPKTQINIKLRECYNRLISRDILYINEEENKLQQLINGVSFSELFLPNLQMLSKEKNIISKNCMHVYELLDFKNIYSHDYFKIVKKANDLLRSSCSKLDKLCRDYRYLINQVHKGYLKLPKTEGNLQQIESITLKLKTFEHNIMDEFETIKIVQELEKVKITEYIQYYTKNFGYGCKYAPYKKIFGHFIGCRVIPKVDKLFQRK